MLILFFLLLLLIAAPAYSEPRATFSIPLKVDVPESITQGSWPVTFGVPMPRGRMKADMRAIVYRDNAPLPTQTTPLATWTPDGGDVRWLLVDCQVDAQQSDTAYELRVFSEQPAPETKLRYSRDERELTIDTGVARFIICDRDAFEITSVQTAGRQLVEPNAPVRFSVMDHRGRRYTASGDLSGNGCVIEDAGSQRIAVKSRGWYRSEGGAGFCQHVTRLEFFAGSTKVRLLHTFIFTGTSESHQIRDIAINLPLAVSRSRQATFGIDAAHLERSKTLENVRHASLVQDCNTRWDLKYELLDRERNQTLATGNKFGGWMNLADSHGGMTVALREAWQNYPNEFEVAGNQVNIHLWPKHGRLLDFRTRAVLEPYGEEGIEAINKYFLSRPKPYAKSIDQIDNNAMGVAKTHELWLEFHAGEFVPSQAVQLAHQANTPVLLSSDPKWNCRTGALISPIHHYDPEQFPDPERLLEAMFDRFVYWQNDLSDFGWYDYGDVHNRVGSDEYNRKLKAGPTAAFWRYWDSTHYGLPNAPWTLYYRSGNRKYLQFAEVNSRHCMDIDRCHFGDGKRRIKGTHYYQDWSIIPWNGYPPEYVMLANYAKLEYLAYAYYLRGYRRALDVMKDYGEALVKYHNNPKAAFPLRMNKVIYKQVRHLGPPMGNMTELYRITWDERYLDVARDYAQAMIDILPDQAGFAKWQGKLPFVWEALTRFAEQTDDKALTDALKYYTVNAAQRGGAYGSFGDVGFGYRFTGYADLLDLGKYRLMQLASVVNTSSEDHAFRGSGAFWVAGHAPYTLRSLPVFLGAVMSAPKSWRDANLPLVRSNQSVHFAGPRLPTVYVRPRSTGQPSLLTQVMQDQVMVVTHPDGRVHRRIKQPVNNIVRLQAGDLPPGVTKLSFPVVPTRKSDDYIDRGNIHVVAAEHVDFIFGPSTDDGKFCAFGPRLFFFVPEAVDTFSIRVQVSDTWAAWAWKPTIQLFDPNGKCVQEQAGPGSLRFDIKADESQRGRCWSVGPVGRMSAPKETATWEDYPYDKHFPSYIELSENLPRFMATRADLFFVPPQ